MKKAYLILFSIVFTANLNAQKLKTKDILSSLVQDERLQYGQQISQFAKGLKYDMPIIKKVEARFGINGNANGDTIYGNIRNEDFYGLVLSTNSLREIKKQKDYKTAQVNALESETRVTLQQALFDRYLTLVTLNFTQDLVAKRQSLTILLDKKHAVLSDMLDKGLDIRIKDVLDTENDKNTVQLAVSDLENTVQLQSNKIKQYLLSDALPSLDYSDFIVISKISEVINAQKMTQSLNPIIDYRNAQNKLAAANFEVEMAQNRQIFSFVQVAYQNPILELETPNKQKSVNNFSVRFGLTVPIPGNNNFKKSETALQLRDAQNDYQLTIKTNQKAIDIQYVKVENLLKQYQICTDRIEQSLIKKMLKNDKLLAQITPLEILELQITQHKLELRAIEIAQEITSEYIRFLDLTGALSAKPYKNYLSSDLEGFSF
jgi:hypothetical protein